MLYMKQIIKDGLEAAIVTLSTVAVLATILFCVFKLIEIYSKSPVHMIAIIISVVVGLYLARIFVFD